MTISTVDAHGDALVNQRNIEVGDHFSVLVYKSQERSSVIGEVNFSKGRVKIYGVPGPEPSTGGRRLKKNYGGEEIFFEKKGAKAVFRKNLGGKEYFY